MSGGNEDFYRLLRSLKVGEENAESTATIRARFDNGRWALITMWGRLSRAAGRHNEPYKIDGTVVRWKKLGRDLMFWRE